MVVRGLGHERSRTECHHGCSSVGRESDLSTVATIRWSLVQFRVDGFGLIASWCVSGSESETIPCNFGLTCILRCKCPARISIAFVGFRFQGANRYTIGPVAAWTQQIAPTHQPFNVRGFCCAQPCLCLRSCGCNRIACTTRSRPHSRLFLSMGLILMLSFPLVRAVVDDVSSPLSCLFSPIGRARAP